MDYIVYLYWVQQKTEQAIYSEYTKTFPITAVIYNDLVLWSGEFSMQFFWGVLCYNIKIHIHSHWSHSSNNSYIIYKLHCALPENLKLSNVAIASDRYTSSTVKSEDELSEMHAYKKEWFPSLHFFSIW